MNTPAFYTAIETYVRERGACFIGGVKFVFQNKGVNPRIALIADGCIGASIKHGRIYFDDSHQTYFIEDRARTDKICDAICLIEQLGITQAEGA